MKTFLFAVFAVLFYCGVAGAGIYLISLSSPRTNAEEIKEFYTRIQLVLVGSAALVGVLASLFTLHRQLTAAKDLEVKKGEIVREVETHKGKVLKEVEDHKEGILKNIETHKGEVLSNLETKRGKILSDIENRKEGIFKNIETHKGEILEKLEERKNELQRDLKSLEYKINLQSDFLKKTIDIKSEAYQKIFVASNLYYRELQKLALGRYDEDKIEDYEKTYFEAEALAAHLNDEEILIVRELTQAFMNTKDSVLVLWETRPHLTPAELKPEYVKIWEAAASQFAAPMEKLRECSLYRNKKTAA